MHSHPVEFKNDFSESSFDNLLRFENEEKKNVEVTKLKECEIDIPGILDGLFVSSDKVQSQVSRYNVIYFREWKMS